MSVLRSNSSLLLMLGAIVLCVLSILKTAFFKPNVTPAKSLTCLDLDDAGKLLTGSIGVALNGPCTVSDETVEDRLDFAALTGVDAHWVSTCQVGMMDWCTQALRTRQIEIQHELFERIKNPDERAQALQSACIDPENAKAVRALLGDRISVDTLYLDACYMPPEPLNSTLVDSLKNPALRTTALHLLAAHDMTLPEDFPSEWAPLFSHWLRSSNR
ncbi:MAG: hypothetical protein ACON4U_15755 [Myxococcota bacterium]